MGPVFATEDSEHLADVLDIGARNTQALTDSTVALSSALAAPEQVQNADGSWPITECVDCDPDLGERAALGRVRCIRCQELLERKRRGYGTL